MKNKINADNFPAREYLLPTPILDSDHPDLICYARDTAGDSLHDPLSAAVKLYYAVRDEIWYDPYAAFYRPEHYRASHVLQSRRGFCIPKAGLLCALARACGIPSRVGFADVRNHLATRQLLEHIGCDLFVFHGYTEFFLEGRWVKATPAFNKELCARHGVEPLEFDGREDSVFQAYNSEKKRFMEYVAFHGEYADIPVDEILRAWKKIYGQQRVQTWIERLEKNSGKSWRNFDAEDIVL